MIWGLNLQKHGDSFASHLNSVLFVVLKAFY